VKGITKYLTLSLPDRAQFMTNLGRRAHGTDLPGPGSTSGAPYLPRDRYAKRDIIGHSPEIRWTEMVAGRVTGSEVRNPKRR